MRKVCNQLNKRLMKWVQWEKGLYVMASVKWLRKKVQGKRESFSPLGIGSSMRYYYLSD
jgi:RNA-directed DNA polymerase